MPLLRYTFDETANPEIAGQSVDLDTETLTLQEAEDLELVTGKPVGAVHLEFNENRASGVRAFVWLALRRAGFALKYSELTFNIVKTSFVIVEPEAPEQEAEAAAPLDQAEETEAAAADEPELSLASATS